MRSQIAKIYHSMMEEYEGRLMGVYPFRLRENNKLPFYKRVIHYNFRFILMIFRLLRIWLDLYKTYI